jgi:hypothetical protein
MAIYPFFNSCYITAAMLITPVLKAMKAAMSPRLRQSINSIGIAAATNNKTVAN